MMGIGQLYVGYANWRNAEKGQSSLSVSEGGPSGRRIRDTPAPPSRVGLAAIAPPLRLPVAVLIRADGFGVLARRVLDRLHTEAGTLPIEGAGALSIPTALTVECQPDMWRPAVAGPVLLLSLSVQATLYGMPAPQFVTEEQLSEALAIADRLRWSDSRSPFEAKLQARAVSASQRP